MDAMFGVQDIQDNYILCPFCGIYVFEYCAIHGSLLVIPDTEVSKSHLPHTLPCAALTLPDLFLHYSLSSIAGAGIGVFSSKAIPLNVRFGPYRGRFVNNVTSRYCWQVFLDKKPAYVIDACDENNSNWMRYINCSRNFQEQNLVAYQHKGQIYYRTIKNIEPFTELLVFYGCEFAQLLGIDLRKYNREYLPIVNNVRNNEDFLSNKYENLYHPIPNGIATEVHRNISVHKAETEENKNLPAEDTRCQTHNLGDSIEIACTGTSNSDTEGKLRESLKKILVCDICDKSFQYMTNWTRHILKHPKKIFICDYCGWKTIYKHNLKAHINCKHAQKFYNCSYCQFKTAHKYFLNGHINAQHSKTIVYKCSFCEHKTYYKQNFKDHINAKHTKEKCYRCKYCNFTSYIRSKMCVHIKNTHKKHNTKV